MNGKSDQAKGRLKEATGKLTGDKDLEREGKTDRAVGRAKDQVDKAKKAADDVLDSAKEAFKKR